MKQVSSFAIPLGHSTVRRDGATKRILSATFGSVRFHLGRIGDAAHVKIKRSFLGGFYETTWEAVGPSDSIHRLPNGATIWIGKSGPSPHNEVHATGVVLTAAPAMWSEIIPLEIPAH